MALRTALFIESDDPRTEHDPVYAGHIKVIPRKQYSLEHGAIVRRLHVRLPRTVAMAFSRGQVLQALRDTMSGGCNHQHDCCGCFFHVAYPRALGRRDYVVNVVSERNV